MREQDMKERYLVEGEEHTLTANLDGDIRMDENLPMCDPDMEPMDSCSNLTDELEKRFDHAVRSYCNALDGFTDGTYDEI